MPRLARGEAQVEGRRRGCVSCWGRVAPAQLVAGDRQDHPHCRRPSADPEGRPAGLVEAHLLLVGVPVGDVPAVGRVLVVVFVGPDPALRHGVRSLRAGAGQDPPDHRRPDADPGQHHPRHHRGVDLLRRPRGRLQLAPADVPSPGLLGVAQGDHVTRRRLPQRRQDHLQPLGVLVVHDRGADQARRVDDHGQLPGGVHDERPRVRLVRAADLDHVAARQDRGSGGGVHQPAAVEPDEGARRRHHPEGGRGRRQGGVLRLDEGLHLRGGARVVPGEVGLHREDPGEEQPGLLPVAGGEVAHRVEEVEPGQLVRAHRLGQAGAAGAELLRERGGGVEHRHRQPELLEAGPVAGGGDRPSSAGGGLRAEGGQAVRLGQQGGE